MRPGQAYTCDTEPTLHIRDTRAMVNAIAAASTFGILSTICPASGMQLRGGDAVDETVVSLPSTTLQRGPRQPRQPSDEQLQYTVIAEWVALEYDWPTTWDRDEAIASGAFQPRNNALVGIKVCNSDVAPACVQESMFLTVPRWLPGVPSTLNTLQQSAAGAPVLRAWPSLEAQNPLLGCSSLQNVQSMEIDPDGLMWVVDVGRKYIYDQALDDSCPPKMVLIDVPSGEILETYTFPPGVAPYNASFLNDIVLDVANQVAYISDTGGGTNDGDLGAIVVYDRANTRSRRFEHVSTHAERTISTVHGLPLAGYPVDGIALHPGGDLFYSTLSGVHLFSVSGKALRDFSLPVQAIAATVVNHGEKVTNSDGMAFDTDGSLFFGGLETDSVYRWDPARAPVEDAIVIARDADELWWVDTFAFDNRGDLLFTSNRLSAFLSSRMDFTGASGSNFRVIKSHVGTSSYMAVGASADVNSTQTADRKSVV